MSKHDLVKFFKEQRDLELSHVDALNDSIKTTLNTFASAILKSIIHDSRKHAVLYGVLMDIESGKIPWEMDVWDALEISQSLEEHVKLEAKMIKHVESLLSGTADARKKGILGYILSDERRHHRILKRITDRAVLSVEDFYEA